MNAAHESSWDSICSFVGATAPQDDVILHAQEAAGEFGLPVPDAVTAEFIEFLAARAAGTAAVEDRTPTAVVMSPASGVIGLHLFAGLNSGGATGHLTCIDPEVQHQQLAKAAFAEADQRPNTFRFLPSAPLDVIGRLASDSYDVVVAETAVEDIAATAEKTIPALRPGGVLVLLDTLLDGLVADDSRTDRQTVQARQADETLRELSGARVSRLPLGAGITVVTKL
ncbi:MAG TPA: O-methyltransferase [Candidatus Corynebacterium gallistercoris]|uniref:O-methyltransferase n=1 Tax=Candidatus Corynebacterium gallistercoris TaxID=2838530 RepID=A0A9D1S002_9CORY|nr:O-methyltransferase [Candidatus Corynebacterium gallistercoris]